MGNLKVCQIKYCTIAFSFGMLYTKLIFTDTKAMTGEYNNSKRK
jgi:hypothetical protein